MKSKIYNKSGVSLIETIVAIGVFVVLSVISAESIALSLRGARKAEAISEVRDNLSFTMSSIEQRIRNAYTINGCSFSNQQSFSYRENEDDPTSITVSCNLTNGSISIGGQQYTNDDIDITGCNFSCTDNSASGLPPTLQIDLTAQKADAPPIEQSPVDISTQIRLRVY